jgi:EmrB/QacA subfamily drug resistance transporter
VKIKIKNHLLIILCVILFLTFLDNTIVSVVLSNVQSTLDAGVQDLQWVVDAYMLVFAVFMLSGGTLGDIFGRKKIMMGGVALFTLGSIGAALSPSSGFLIASRAIMGLGAAASEPGTLSMIRHIYTDRRERSRALGVWAAVSGMALAFGPIIGGVIIGFSNWRGVFVFSAIFGAIALVAGIFTLPENSDPTGRKLDISGLIFWAVALATVIFALIFGENAGYGMWWIALLFGLSLISVIIFIFVERSKKDPVLPLSFFNKIQFSIANLVAFSANFGIFAVFFFVALYLQLIANFSGYQIAVAFISMTAAIVISAVFSGRWNAIHKTIWLMVSGCLLSGIGILILESVISPNVGTATLAWALSISGIGFGMCLVTMTSSVLNIVPIERSGMAASTVNTFRELGGVFGVAILGAIVNSHLTTKLIDQLKTFGLPSNFQSFVIYAITHGGNTPKGLSVTPAELASHGNIISKVTKAAYQAFSSGLAISLDIASSLLLLTGLICVVMYLWRNHRFSDIKIKI